MARSSEISRGIKMKLIIGKDIVIENPNQAVLNYCKEELTLDNPDYIIANKLGRYVGRMDKQVRLFVQNGNTLILPFGCLDDIWELARNSKTEYETRFHAFRGNELKGKINLYDYQEKALEKLFLGRNGILEAPCGSGKTQIGLALIKKIGGKALWLTHTKKLMLQSLERAKAYFEGDFGTITEGQIHIGRDITFATVQTMRSLDTSAYENEFDIVIVDECHHCVGTPTKVMQFYKVLTNCNARYKYGLSATLSRGDNLMRSVYSIIGRKLHTITEKEVGSKIIKAKHIKVEINLDYSMRDYCEGDGTINYTKLITMLSEREERNTLIVEKVMNLYSLGKKQLVLCHRVNQVKELSDRVSRFCKVNCIVGSIRDKNREYDGDVIIATYSLAKEGLDIPTLDVVHFATPQKDKAIVKQSAGRVERNIKGKEQPLVMDYVDTRIDYCNMCYRKRLNILKKN